MQLSATINLYHWKHLHIFGCVMFVNDVLFKFTSPAGI